MEDLLVVGMINMCKDTVELPEYILDSGREGFMEVLPCRMLVLIRDADRN